MQDPYSSISTVTRLTYDTAVAAAAGFTLGFFITPVDVSVFEYMSQRVKTIRESLFRSLKDIATQPHRYIFRKEFIVVAGTYTGTYAAKNAVDTYSMVKH